MRAIARPTAVARPSSSRAPSPRRVALARASAVAGSGSGRRSPSPPGEPQQARSRVAWVRSAVCTSGVVKSRRRAQSDSGKQRTTVPGPRRAARPARCWADERASETVTRPLMPRPESKRGSRARPASTTSRTPGTVRELSATAVDTMMRRSPPSRMTSSWARPSTCPNSSSATRPRARNPSATRETSRAPGRKTSALPCAAAKAEAVVLTTWSRKAGVTPRASSR